ncbi:permease of the major facilitator superfamily [Vibrio maritimus]|uniref:Permease of the major facilitator superfamily n=1 Tax=Vibrio maritimus TaxID=990268 RepID=A0A090SXD1_9VIBR|nr:permease of the major facilitator superfamily [Vibrio maritimus]
MGNFIIPFLVLLLTEKLGYSATHAGLLAMFVTATYFVGGFVGGKLSDSFGHKRIIVVGELFGSMLLILCGFFSEHPTAVPVLLFSAYFWMGIASPASNALVADLSVPNNRDAVMSLSYLAYNLGSAVGPVIAGYLFWSNTEWVFWGNGLAALAGVIIIGAFVSNEKHTGEDCSDFEREVEGSVWRVLFERPRLVVFTLFCGVLWFVLHQMTMASPLYLSNLFEQQGAVIFGQLMTYACIVVVVITPLLMKLTMNKTEMIAMSYAGLLFGTGYGLILALPTVPIHFFAWFFLAAGEVLLLTKEGVYLANNSPTSHRGRIQGVLISLRSILVMPSFVIVGYMIDNYGYSSTWGVIIFCSGLATLGFYSMEKLRKAPNNLETDNLNN